MNREIGSEFWNTMPNRCEEAYLLSGRTALDFIIRDILQTHQMKSALLPSYCCHTMIEPFLRNGICVRFYDVYFDPQKGLCADVPDLLENELFYYMTYFGFSQLWGVDLPRIRQQAQVIIEDKTHSLYSSDVPLCDYSFTSYRKWGGFYGIARAKKTTGAFRIDSPSSTSSTYCELRKQAFAQKAAYIQTGVGSKDAFRSLFEQAEKLLECDYANLSPAPESCLQLIRFDFEAAAARRRANADVLLRRLQNVDGLQLLFSKRLETDVPLFVPILLRNCRNELRQYLIEKQIFIPVHWPVTDAHDCLSSRTKQIYNEELSLVCDQRYTVNDMECMADFIADYLKTHSSK